MTTQTSSKAANNLGARIALAALLAYGLWSGASLSLGHYRSGEACPIMGDLIPACYIAFGAYLLMATAVVARLIAPTRNLSILFWIGLGVAGGLALIGSALEAYKGDICPQAFGWLPLCYVSLAFSVAMGWLYPRAATRAHVGAAPE